jgi:hypothetical protein
LTHIAWLSRYRVNGGWYGAEIVVAAAHVNAGPRFDGRWIGDMTILPLILQWNEKKLSTVSIWRLQPEPKKKGRNEKQYPN